MPILLIRHADAVLEDRDLPDEARYLSASGRRDAAALGEELRAAGLVPARFVTSPLVRAVQTTELVARAAGFEVEVTVDGDLAPGGSVRHIAQLLGEAPDLVVAVGHEPSMSALAGALSGQARFPAMRKAEACLVEGGQLRRWFGSDRR
jgi:phosphohistidine phosphatase